MDNIEERFLGEKKLMDNVFASLIKKSEDKQAVEFFDMSFNYYKDAQFFYEKGDFVRAYEGIVISWSYIDAGLKVGFFGLPNDLLPYFTLE